ncbi:MAG: hypothetical protein PHO10_11495 [Gemmiger sp.]|nr:hypothetical protein [Gemmiger sp.]
MQAYKKFTPHKTKKAGPHPLAAHPFAFCKLEFKKSAKSLQNLGFTAVYGQKGVF